MPTKRNYQQIYKKKKVKPAPKPKGKGRNYLNPRTGKPAKVLKPRKRK